LEEIDDVKKIRLAEAVGGALDRVEESFAVDRLGKDFRVRATPRVRRAEPLPVS